MTVAAVKNRKRKKIRFSAFDVCNTVFLVILSLTIIFPFWDIIIRSVSDVKTSNTLTFMLWPSKATLSSYRFILRDNSILNAYGITIARTVVGVVISLIMILAGAYPLSKRDLPGRTLITIAFLIPMFFSGGLIPSYLVNRSLGFIDSFWVYIIPSCVGIYNVILCRNFLMSMDKSLEESAFIDGAGYLTVLVRIVAPLTKPIIATLALWIAVSHWNAWFDCMIYIRSSRLEVVQMILKRMQDLSNFEQDEMAEFMFNNPDQMVTSVSVRMAITLITVLPIICIYPFIQKYFVKGIMVGSLKG